MNKFLAVFNLTSSGFILSGGMFNIFVLNRTSMGILLIGLSCISFAGGMVQLSKLKES
jgi:hypothetical protein